jgi:hypothetical protein
MGHGGKREGAGRREGSKNRATLEKQAVLEAFNQRVMNKVHELFDAQITLALGSAKVFRIDEEETESGKTKRVHTLVTDADEIKELLDEHEGLNGEVNGKFYYFTTVQPDNKAIEAMLNRSLGRATERVEHTFKSAELIASTTRELKEKFNLSDDVIQTIIAEEMVIS